MGNLGVMETNMWSRCPLVVAALVSGLLCMANVGCAVFGMSYASIRYAASLNETTRIDLIEYGDFNAALRGPKYNHRELTLCISRRGRTSWYGQPTFLSDVQVDRVVGEHWRDVPTFRLGELEGRRDASGRKVWVVDKEAGRVIATVDLDTGATTGAKDDPPGWAQMDGGIVLRTILPCPRCDYDLTGNVSGRCPECGIPVTREGRFR